MIDPTKPIEYADGTIFVATTLHQQDRFTKTADEYYNRWISRPSNEPYINSDGNSGNLTYSLVTGLPMKELTVPEGKEFIQNVVDKPERSDKDLADEFRAAWSQMITLKVEMKRRGFDLYDSTGLAPNYSDVAWTFKRMEIL